MKPSEMFNHIKQLSQAHGLKVCPSPDGVAEVCHEHRLLMTPCPSDYATYFKILFMLGVYAALTRPNPPATLPRFLVAAYVWAVTNAGIEPPDEVISWYFDLFDKAVVNGGG